MSKQIFRYEDKRDNSFEVYCLEGKVYFTVENPWSGDSETGFGEECSIEMSISEAKKLAKYLESLEEKPRSDPFSKFGGTLQG